MAALMLRDLSDVLYGLLKQEAKLHKRSMNKEIIALLEQRFLPPPRLRVKDFPRPVKPKHPIDDAFIQDAISRSRA
jgi:hypothetical protein